MISAKQAQVFMANAMGISLVEISVRMNISYSRAAHLLWEARKKALQAGLHFTVVKQEVDQKQSGFSALQQLAAEAGLVAGKGAK
jgi:hypothetical protein